MSEARSAGALSDARSWTRWLILFPIVSTVACFGLHFSGVVEWPEGPITLLRVLSPVAIVVCLIFSRYADDFLDLWLDPTSFDEREKRSILRVYAQSYMLILGGIALAFMYSEIAASLGLWLPDADQLYRSMVWKIGDMLVAIPIALREWRARDEGE